MEVTPSSEATVEVTPSPKSDIGSSSSESQAGDAVDSYLPSPPPSTRKQPTYGIKRRTPAFNRESLTVEQIIGISSGTFFFLVLLAYAAEYVDEQTAARKRKEEEARKKKEDEARKAKLLKLRKAKKAKLQKEKELKKKNRTTVVRNK
jgi:hypothetical protein